MTGEIRLSLRLDSFSPYHLFPQIHFIFYLFIFGLVSEFIRFNQSHPWLFSFIFSLIISFFFSVFQFSMFFNIFLFCSVNIYILYFNKKKI